MLAQVLLRREYHEKVLQVYNLVYNSDQTTYTSNNEKVWITIAL